MRRSLLLFSSGIAALVATVLVLSQCSRAQSSTPNQEVSQSKAEEALAPGHSHDDELDVLKWRLFWDGPTAALRNRLSEPAEERYQKLWQEVAEKAHESGFIFEVPPLRQTSAEYEKVIREPEKIMIFAMTDSGVRVSYLNMRWIRLIPDRVVRTIMAHELGHAIDAQMGRVGHDVFIGRGLADSEAIADAVAEKLYGFEAVMEMRTMDFQKILKGERIL